MSTEGARGQVALEAIGLSRSFSGRRVVDGLSLLVGRGEVVGLLGPNGAGKTTSLRLLATLLDAESGSVRIDGIDARKEGLRARARLAFVPAEVGISPQLSPREEVELAARLQGAPMSEVQPALQRMGVLDYADRPCGELSTGMKRRVALARALVHRPALWLLDEPTDGLDVGGRREVLELIRSLAAGGAGILLSSHVMAEVQAVAQRFVVMHRGRVVGEGDAASLLQRTGKLDLDEAFLMLTGDSP